MSAAIKVAFASCDEKLYPRLVDEMRGIYPELPLYVVSEFPPPDGRWIPWKPQRTFTENLARCRAAFGGRPVRIAAVVLQPRQPYDAMKWMALRLNPFGFLAFNENFGHFMLRPRSAGVILRHLYWRARTFAVRETHPGGALYTWIWRVFHPFHLLRPFYYWRARISGWVTARIKGRRSPRPDPDPGPAPPAGISVVVPSRNGKALLERMLPSLFRELATIAVPTEVIVVDNGSGDGTAKYLADAHPEVIVDRDPDPLSFACAVNRGIRRARYSHVCLLNNDMVLEPGFFPPLLDAFHRVPELFSATAQILFPPGVRREETGKAVMPPLSDDRESDDFPVRCDLPLAGEDQSYVLYGSGGCTLYDARKLRSLGLFGELYTAAYVEDLDVGYRAWQRNWPNVYCAGARVVHYHRATTTRFYTPEMLQSFLEYNYLRFVARAVATPEVFARLWKDALWRLNLVAVKQRLIGWARAALAYAWKAPRHMLPPPPEMWPEQLILAIGSGAVAVFPGRPAAGRRTVLVASPYLPFPLSHGGAVRMFNLMRRAARDFDQVLVAFVEELASPPPELLSLFSEIVLVKLYGSHLLPSTDRPDTVEEFDSPAFHGALQQTVRKWRPAIAQLEYTQMAQYAADCRPARTILVEHDITFDLYAQLLLQSEDWETRRQWERWVRFEKSVWPQVDRVVTMSEKDRAVVERGAAVTLANGVDVDRFQPSNNPPEPARLLFIGAFRHTPNLMAIDWFLREVWPHLPPTTLHIIAGTDHQRYIDLNKDTMRVDLGQAGIEVEDFVADVRPAYRRATLVIAPLLASAGTNIKIMEAMAMGKAIVSTPAGINGLDLTDGSDVALASTAAGFAARIRELLGDPEARRRMESNARETALRNYDWDAIAEAQATLYRSLVPMP